MNNENLQQLIKYWLKTAKHDYDTMCGLFKIKRYADSLFYGHIVLEKILKGLVVKITGKPAPYIHNLLRLAKLAGLNLTEEEKELLDAVNRFNIRSRYPDYKLEFYKLCSLKYTEKHLTEIKKIYQKLWAKLKQKK